MTAINRLILSGTLPGGEVWSTSCAYRATNIIDGQHVFESYEDLNELVNRTYDRLEDTATWGQLRILLSNAGYLTGVRWEYRNEGLLMQAAEQNRTPMAGSNAMTKPFQTSVVVSLLTGRPGRSYRGRMFLPALGASISGSTGRMTDTQCQAIADEMAENLVEWGRGDLVVNDLMPGVYSTLNDEATPLNSVQVGDVLDVQRRRRDSLVEVRYDAEIV